MTVESRLHAFGLALEEHVTTDYLKVVAAYRRRRRRHVILAIAGAAAMVATFGGVIVGADSLRTHDTTHSLHSSTGLAITDQVIGAAGSAVQPAGLDGHYVLVTPSAAIIAAGVVSPCPAFMTEPTLHGPVLFLRYQRNTSVQCQATSKTSGWAPIMLLFNRPVFDSVSRVVVTDNVGDTHSYTPKDAGSIDRTGLPGVITVNVAVAKAPQARLSLYFLTGHTDMYEHQLKVAGDGAYQLAAPRAPGQYRIDLTSESPTPCASATVQVRPAAATSVTLTCSSPPP